MSLSDVKDKLVSLAQAHSVTLKILLVLSASVVVYGSALSLIFNKNLGLYASLIAAVLSVPKNLLAAYAVRRLFVP